MTQYRGAKAPENIKDQWETPDFIFNVLNEVFHFTVDAAANADNAKLPRYWSIDDDGLKQDWSNERVFCNPPHSNGAYGEWTQKAANEKENLLSVLVLPANLETKGFTPVWNHARYLILPYTRIGYTLPDHLVEEYRKRQQLKNNLSDEDAAKLKFNSPNFYSAIAVFAQRNAVPYGTGLVELTNIGRIIELHKVWSLV